MQTSSILLHILMRSQRHCYLVKPSKGQQQRQQTENWRFCVFLFVYTHVCGFFLFAFLFVGWLVCLLKQDKLMENLIPFTVKIYFLIILKIAISVLSIFIILGDLSVVCWAELILNWRRSTGDQLWKLAHVLLYEVRQTEVFHACILFTCLSLMIFLLSCQLIKFQLNPDPEEIQGQNELWTQWEAWIRLGRSESVSLRLTHWEVAHAT